jgi:uncharacterized protein (DUF885 family)
MLGARIDLADTYAFGWAELERLVGQARELAEQIGGGGDDPVRDAASVLDADPRYRLEGVDAIRGWLQRRVGETTVALAEAASGARPYLRKMCAAMSSPSGGMSGLSSNGRQRTSASIWPARLASAWSSCL